MVKTSDSIHSSDTTIYVPHISFTIFITISNYFYIISQNINYSKTFVSNIKIYSEGGWTLPKTKIARD